MRDDLRKQVDAAYYGYAPDEEDEKLLEFEAAEGAGSVREPGQRTARKYHHLSGSHCRVIREEGRYGNCPHWRRSSKSSSTGGEGGCWINYSSCIAM